MATKRRGKYYLYGYESGQDAANYTDWLPGEMLEKYEGDDLGEVVGQILENWQQMAGTIYYRDVSDSQLNAFEEGFYDGFADEVKKTIKGEKKHNQNPRGQWFVFHSGGFWYIGQEETNKTKKIGRVGGPRGTGSGLNYYDRAMEEAKKRNFELGFGYEAHISYPTRTRWQT